MATSKVAPPQHSSDSSCGKPRAQAAAEPTMSKLRMRVASSDWWASRMVVSVTSTRRCSRIHAAKPCGPSLSNSCLAPSAGAAAKRGASGRRALAGGRGRPLASGWPLTLTSAM